MAIGVIAAVLIAVFIGLDFYQKAKQKEGVAENNLLKAPKEKIIDYKIQPENAPNAADLKTNSQGIVIYRYVSTKEVPAAAYQGLKEDLSKRTNNSQTFLKSIKPISDKFQQEEYIAKFFTGPTFQKSGDKWYWVETATTTPTAFANQTKLTLLDQAKEFFGQNALADTFYSGGGDGYVTAGSGSWFRNHNAADGDSVSTSTVTALARAKGIQSDDAIIVRAFLPFDTSAIPSIATINSATLSIYVTAKEDDDNDGLDYINIIQTNQPNSTILTYADYNNCGATTTPATGATAIDLTAGFTVSAYNTFTLDATGLTWIAKSGDTSSCGTTAGVTCLGLREGHDLTDSSPGDALSNSLTFSTVEAADASQDPFLTVSYTAVAPVVIKINGGTIKINGGTIKIN